MDQTAWVVIGVGVIAVVAMLVMGSRLGSVRVWFFGKSGFEARSQQGPTASAEGAKAGGSIRVKNEAGGSATAARARADQDIEVTSTDAGTK